MKQNFEIKSGIMVASDPCYTIPTWCQGIISNVKNGTWSAEVKISDEGDWGKRIAMLKIKHIGSKPITKYEELNFNGGVDSGQFGFFDKEFYRNDEAVKELPKYDFGGDFKRDDEDGEEWYLACCNITLKKRWGCLPNGVVSETGFGDGSYGVYGRKDTNGEWVEFKVRYI